MKTWTHKDIVKLTGLETWQIKYPADKELVNPVFLGGKGKARHYDKDGVYKIVIASELMKFRIPTDQSREILERVKFNGNENNFIEVKSQFSTLKIDIQKIVNELQI